MNLPSDVAKLNALRTVDAFDCMPGPSFARIARHVADVFGVQVASITMRGPGGRCEIGRHGPASAAGELELRCFEQVLRMKVRDCLILIDGSGTSASADNRQVRFCAGVPLALDTGEVIGALFVFDPERRDALSEAEIERLHCLAEIAVAGLAARKNFRREREKRELLELSERVAGVGHWRYDVVSGAVIWSDEVYRIHGVTPECFDPELQSALDFYPPEDRPTVEAFLAKVIETGEEDEFRLRIVRRSGEVRHVVSRALVERSPSGEVCAVFGVYLDVTDQVSAHAALAEAERRYRLLAEHSTDTIARVSLEAEFLYVSAAVERLSGYTPDELVGRSTLPLIHPEDRVRVTRAYGKLVKFGEQARSQLVQYRLRHKSGCFVWVEVAPTLVRDAAGHPLEFVDVTRDITERKLVEQELLAAKAAADAAATAKSDFLANMSHELRTPLTSIIGFSGLMAGDQGLPDKFRRHVDRISTGSKALLAVIGDILDYSKLESGAVDLDPAPFSLALLLEEATDIVSQASEEKGIRIQLALDPAIPDLRLGDDLRLRQVLLNLLSNAIKFTPGGGRISLSVVESGGDRLRFAVQDTGVGVSPEAKAKLFQRFSQADMSIARSHGGTGLGLAICRQLVELMGGEIDVSSELGRGATFWFEVRLREPGDVIEPVEASAATPLFVGRVLVADDSEANRELLKTYLAAWGVQSRQVSDGVEALHALQTEAFDCVLMDLHMPVLDGLAAARTIMASPWADQPPRVIGITASADPKVWKAAQEAGFETLISKPIALEQLKDVLLQRRGRLSISWAA
jgi:PAS domain S-box-containing protein